MVWWILKELLVWLLWYLDMVYVGYLVEWVTLLCMVQFWYDSYSSHLWATNTWLRDIYDDMEQIQVGYWHIRCSGRLQVDVREETKETLVLWWCMKVEGGKVAYIHRLEEDNSRTYACFSIYRSWTCGKYFIYCCLSSSLVLYLRVGFLTSQWALRSITWVFFWELVLFSVGVDKPQRL
jgi:hypothetical protein